MANEILARMLALTACITVAALAVLVLRRFLRRQFGAGAAYASWLLMPVACAAAFIPSGPESSAVLVLAAPLSDMAHAVRTPAAQAPAGVATAIVALWILSAMLAMAWQVLRYRSFVLSLGPLDPTDGVAFASGVHEGPLLLGVLRPLVVLPPDFELRYSAPERELIMAHERSHARRRDPLVNAACALAKCVWWFNPVIHYAARCLRIDQELACDQSVMRAHPGSSRTYAEAMLKTQLSDSRAPFACQWQSNHPLKERVLNLNHTHLTPWRRLMGRSFIAVLLATGAWSAWAAQGEMKEASTAYDIAMVISADGTTSAPRMRVRAGQAASIRVGQDGGRLWDVKMQLTPGERGTVLVQATLTKDGEIVSNPSLLIRLSEKGTIRVDDAAHPFSLEMTVREVPAPVSAAVSTGST